MLGAVTALAHWIEGVEELDAPENVRTELIQELVHKAKSGCCSELRTYHL